MKLEYEHLRAAALDVLNGKLPKPVGIMFDNYSELKIGTRRILEKKGLAEVQPPHTCEADDALDADDERVFRRVYEDLIKEGFIVDVDDQGRFHTVLLPSPFDKRWTFEESLAGGGQGSTRKVRDRSGSRLGVLKVPHTMNQVAKERFRREVDILTKIDDPSVVKLLDFNLDESLGALGYVTPFGTPLAEYWSKASPSMGPTERYNFAYTFLRQLCTGLSLLHKQGVVHRDIKPENVIIIDGTAVLIDFGVAYRSVDPRLSVIDGKVVANNFATPHPAQYGPTDVDPSWDCLGLAWLYGFLIGTAPKPKQFHWRFHPLVEEPRSDRAKALLAVCSHESTIPRTADEFLALMDKFRLNGSGPETVPPDVMSVVEAEAAHADNLAREAIKKAEDTDMLERCVQLFEAPLVQVRSAMVERCTGSSKLPVKQFENDFNIYSVPISGQRPMAGIMKEAYQHSIESPPHVADGRVCIFNCLCGENRKFRVSAHLVFKKHHSGDDLQFWLHLSCTLEYGTAPVMADAGFSMHKNGAFRRIPNGEEVSAAEIALVAQGWVRDPKHWRHLGQ